MEDVFQHDDGVIHDHADAEPDTAQRHHVERDIQRKHDQEGKQDAARHCNRNRNGCADVAQEHDQHDRREQHAHPDVGHGVVHRHIDVIRLVHYKVPVECTILGGQAVELRLCTLGDLDRVRAGLLVDRQQQALLAVDLGHRILVLGLHGYVRDLVQADRTACRQRDQGVLHVVHRLILAVRAHGQRLRAAVQLAARHGDIVRAQLLSQRGQCQVVAAQARCIHLDRDLIFIAARNIHRGHAVQPLKRGGEVILCD